MRSVKKKTWPNMMLSPAQKDFPGCAVVNLMSPPYSNQPAIKSKGRRTMTVRGSGRRSMSAKGAGTGRAIC